MNSIKKVFSVALAASMVLSMAACGNDTPAPSSSAPEASSPDVSETSASSEADAPKEKGKTTLLDLGYKSKTWSPHEWNSNDEGALLDHTTSDFYRFKPNEAKDNFELECMAAAAMPVDVTKEYAGNETYGVPADAESGWAYRVQLRDDLCWDDGTPINANDFVESQKRLLDPQMKNYRASDCYDGNVSYANARDYYYDGTEGTKKVTWDDVGLKATGDYELTYILGKPCSMFYFMYNGGIKAVKLDVYDANKQQTGDIVKSKYCTTAENTPSYGPFKLVEHQKDKMFKLEKNENWFGYKDGYEGWVPDYDAIELQVVEEHATQMQLFLQGKLDTISLNNEDMKIYGSSDYLMLTPQDFTTKFTFNTDKECLKKLETEGVCKTMPTYIEFRKAFSRMINRKEYCQALTACHIPGFGLFNRRYLSDPEQGIVYRDTPRAQEALLAVYGGDDPEAITGYNLEEAKQLFQEAYEKAKAAGDYHDGDKIEIKFLFSQDGEGEQKIVTHMDSIFKDAVVGTGFEGNVSCSMSVDPDYFGAIGKGAFEVALTTWGGAAMNPFTFTDVYCNEGKLHEFGFHPAEEMLTGTVQGEEYTMSYTDWHNELHQGKWANAEPAVRAEVLAVVEEGLLLQYRMIPVYYRMAGSLTSHRLTYECDEFIPNCGYGKEFLSMDDAEWASHIAECDGKLEY